MFSRISSWFRKQYHSGTWQFPRSIRTHCQIGHPWRESCWVSNCSTVQDFRPFQDAGGQEYYGPFEAVSKHGGLSLVFSKRKIIPAAIWGPIDMHPSYFILIAVAIGVTGQLLIKIGLNAIGKIDFSHSLIGFSESNVCVTSQCYCYTKRCAVKR